MGECAFKKKAHTTPASDAHAREPRHAAEVNTHSRPRAHPRTQLGTCRWCFHTTPPLKSDDDALSHPAAAPSGGTLTDRRDAQNAENRDARPTSEQTSTRIHI